jgi:benzoate transport
MEPLKTTQIHRAAGPPAALDSYARKSVWASALGYGMDGYDLLIIGFALIGVSASLGLSKTEAGSLATITLIGAVAGGFLFGVLSDYIGRIRVLTYSIVLFAVFTGLTAVATSYPEIAVFRFVAGLGLGGEFGIGMTLVAEAWPAARRAQATSFVGLGWQAGVLVAAVLSTALLPYIGWRGMFALGVIPAIVAFIYRRRMDEPALFRERQRSAQVSGIQKDFPIRLLWRDKHTIRASIGMLILCSVQNFGYYGVMTWLPSYLSHRFGYGLTKTGTWTAVTILGMAFGIFIFGFLADRFGRRPVMWAFQIGAALSVIVYSQLSNSLALLIGGAIMGIFINGMLGGYGALMAELFPTEARATAQNVLFNIGRGIGGLAPIVFAAIAASYSLSLAIALLAILYIIDILATAFLISERKGAELT